MTVYSFLATVSASPQRLSTLAIAAGAVLPGSGNLFTSAYLPACKLFLQAIQGAAVAEVYLGPSNVAAAGTNAAITLIPGTTTAPGASEVTESQNDNNTVDLSQWWLIGGHVGDTVSVVYHQA